MFLLDLPDVMIEQIFSFLTYDEVAKNRIVCKDFDVLCQRILNRGFLMIERRHSLSLKAIKALLPRRESERRFHTFSRHCDILTSMETRLSMLSMTYTKFIDHNICCFIPGKVIDEVRRVLSIVEKSETLPRAHEVLQELRDISSMAIEHFDDKVSPALRAKMQASCRGGIPNNGFSSIANHLTFNPSLDGAPSSDSNGGPPSVPSPAQMLQDMKIRCIRSQRSVLQVARKMHKIHNKLRWYKRQVNVQNRIIKEISKKQADQECNMAELKRRIEECDVKYQELNSQGGKGIKDMASSVTSMCGPSKMSKHFGSQIRLDPPLQTIGTKRKGRDSPNIKRRKTTLDPPTPEISSQMLVIPGSLSRAKRRRLLHDQNSISDSISHIQSNITHNVFKNISSVLSDLLGSEGKRKKAKSTETRSERPYVTVANSSAFRSDSDLEGDNNRTFAKIQNKLKLIKQSLMENNIEDDQSGEMVHGREANIVDLVDSDLEIVEDDEPPFINQLHLQNKEDCPEGLGIVPNLIPEGPQVCEKSAESRLVGDFDKNPKS